MKRSNLFGVGVRCIGIVAALGSMHVEAATTRRVNPAGTGTPVDGSTWDRGYRNLQDALSAALPSDDIWVKAGTYKPVNCTTCTEADREISFRLPYKVTIWGGFAGFETSVVQRNVATNLTNLSGDLLGNDLPNFVNRGDNSHHVVNVQGFEEDFFEFVGILDGFTIRGGNAGGFFLYGDEPGGGGIRLSGFPQCPPWDPECTPPLGFLEIRNCTITDNRADHAGAGIYNLSGYLIRIINSEISNNTAYHPSQSGHGGGIGNKGTANLEIINCRIVNNTARVTGGGVYLEASNDPQSPQTQKIINSLIANNVCLGNSVLGTLSLGAGIRARGNGTNLEMRNCTVTGNFANRPSGLGGAGGGGLAVTFDATVRVYNSIIWGNDAVDFGKQISNFEAAANLQVFHSNTQNRPTFSDISGPIQVPDPNTNIGTVDITDNPRFYDPAGTVDNDPVNDFKLTHPANEANRCIDSGDNAQMAIAGQLTPQYADLASGPRLIDDTSTDDGAGAPQTPMQCAYVDMGSYEFQPNPSEDCDGNFIEDFCDLQQPESDCNANMIPDVCEGGPMLYAKIMSDPPDSNCLWRSANNFFRMTFACDITAPPPGKVVISEMLNSGQFGPDLSASFTFTVENDGQGNPRVLKIQENGTVLTHGKWYDIHNLAWPGIEPFCVQYPVLVGDADNDCSVVNADLSVINSGNPCASNCDPRKDINGDGLINGSDVKAANAHVPTFGPPARPSGHLSCIAY
ncbi:MAG: right-handed parallel beta-helix repeat-containing protein [Planctomycetota bacterium]